MVARCVQLPPIRAARSTTATRRPCLDACIAAPSPPGPVPITTTSKVVSSIQPSVATLGDLAESPPSRQHHTRFSGRTVAERQSAGHGAFDDFASLAATGTGMVAGKSLGYDPGP